MKIHKLKKILKFIALGDIHFGNPSNKTSYIIESFRLFFLKYKDILKKLDYIFINGDLLDRILLANSNEYNLIVLWLIDLSNFCKKNNIKLRLLEGTPSHDNEQGKTMYEAIMRLNKDLNFKYIKDIEIEYDNEFDMNILYVPDKNDKPALDRYKDIKKLMKEKNLEKIDFAMMHGNFKYQLPITSIHAHTEEDFLNIVRYYICINHIHTPSVYGRILAPGSFDRMVHGEEEDKGVIYVEVENENKMMFNFLKNENARIQKTFYITEKDPEKALTKLHKELSKLPYTAFVRLITKFKLNISKNIKEIYNFYSVKEEVKGDVNINTSNIFKIENNIEELNITPSNIYDLLKNEIMDLKENDILFLNNTIKEINNKWKL